MQWRCVNMLSAVILAAHICSHEAANILGVFLSPSPSHFVGQRILMGALLDRGHNITIITTTQLNISNSSAYREIFLADEIGPEMMETHINIWKGGPLLALRSLPSTFSNIANRTDALLNDPQVQTLLNASHERLDLAIIGWFVDDSMIGLAAHFRCPSVIISPQTPLKLIRDYVGNPASVSTVPLLTIGHRRERMGFGERVKEFIAYGAEYAFVLWLNKFVFEANYNRNFPQSRGYATYDDAKKNVSLVLVNHHFSLGGVRPLLPSLVEVSGIQAKLTPDPLPEPIAKFMNEALNGVILFSLGSNVGANNIAVDKIRMVLDVFARLKQRVLFKWGERVDDIPANVLVSKWLPQNDVLAHKNLLLFVSHCGMGSINEARFHGVPILGIPFFGDQLTNAETVAAEGWGQVIPIDELAADNLGKGINEMLTNGGYRTVAQRFAAMYRDRPLSALDTAIYWVEYVIRYGGARHLQNDAVHLNFFQLYSLDVIALLVFVAYCTVKAVQFSLKPVFGQRRESKIKKS